jgi:hypothetical protein
VSGNTLRAAAVDANLFTLNEVLEARLLSG